MQTPPPAPPVPSRGIVAPCFAVAATQPDETIALIWGSAGAFSGTADPPPTDERTARSASDSKTQRGA
jgi:hypothetical protein